MAQLYFDDDEAREEFIQEHEHRHTIDCYAPRANWWYESEPHCGLGRKPKPSIYEVHQWWDKDDEAPRRRDS